MGRTSTQDNTAPQRDIRPHHVILFAQPIVTLPQRHVLHYEVFARLKVERGTYIAASDYKAVFTQESQMNHIDTLALHDILQTIKTCAYRADAKFFINIKPHTLRDPHFMGAILDTLTRTPHMGKKIVFEIPYQDLLLLSPLEQKIAYGLIKAGCAFSVDHLDDIPVNAQFLHLRGVRFVKVDAAGLVAQSRSADLLHRAQHRHHALAAHNITLIAQKIEDNATLLNILDLEITLGQGHLTGRPEFRSVYLNES